jgi:hypothetical protein
VNVSPDQLLTEIGRLHVANQVLTEQLAASRQQLVEQAAEHASQQGADASTEPPMPG